MRCPGPCCLVEIIGTVPCRSPSRSSGNRVSFGWPTGCGAAWLARLLWEQEAAGSNPAIPTSSEHISILPKIVCEAVMGAKCGLLAHRAPHNATAARTRSTRLDRLPVSYSSFRQSAACTSQGMVPGSAAQAPELNPRITAHLTVTERTLLPRYELPRRSPGLSGNLA
jgi:hypothetical protein